MRRVPALALVLLAALAGPARAEIAVLANGQTLKLDGHREEESDLVLVLRGGGELRVVSATVRGFVPDEVMEEIVAPAGEDLRALAVAVARRHGVDPELVLAVVAVESAFQPKAVSPKGAQGLMQLMPRTASSLGVDDAFDPAANLDGGTRYLGSLLTLYGGDLQRALAAYNAGAGAVARHGGVPPYRETRDYVRKVIQRYRAEGAEAAPQKPAAQKKGVAKRRATAKPIAAPQPDVVAETAAAEAAAGRAAAGSAAASRD
jgi:soluble lytic murein transglycosylase-like protein